jgi:hypothetical protein
MGYRLNLDLPKEPRPEILHRVLKLLGVLAATDDDADNAERGSDHSKACENSPGDPAGATAAPLLVGRDEAATMLNISTSTLDRWRKNGILPVVELPGAAPMFSRKALRKFVDGNSRIKRSRNS